jgi:hypothetical protein
MGVSSLQQYPALKSKELHNLLAIQWVVCQVQLTVIRVQLQLSGQNRTSSFRCRPSWHGNNKTTTPIVTVHGYADNHSVQFSV